MQETLFLIDEWTGRALQFGDLKRHLLLHQALRQAELSLLLYWILLLSVSQKLDKNTIDRNIWEDIKFFVKVFFSYIILGTDSDVIIINTQLNTLGESWNTGPHLRKKQKTKKQKTLQNSPKEYISKLTKILKSILKVYLNVLELIIKHYH